MRVDGNNNSNGINRINRVTGTENHHRQVKNGEKIDQKQQGDTFQRSTREDIEYAQYIKKCNEYIQPLYASLYNQRVEPLTANDELEIDNGKDKHSKVEKSSQSKHTHNNESRHYNQDSNPEKDGSEFNDSED